MAAPVTTSPPRRYSVDEILSLRSSLPFVNCVVGKLNKHPDIVEIFRIPDEALNDPDRYHCQSRALVDATNRRKVLQIGNRRTEASTEKRDEQLVSAYKLNSHSRQQQWHLRRRDICNRSSEPHPAPSGIASQQSENFQRFYRAVVSPTHVRVTAGGRIVPNTRATVPPQFNWNPEKCLFEPRRAITEIELNKTQAQEAWLPNPSQPVVASPLPPAPLPNYNLLAQSASLAHATMVAQSPSSIQPSSDKDKPAMEAANHLLYHSNAQQPIKISPPSQFDHSRPFMFNGQLVYPVPNGFQPPPNSVPVPISVLGDRNLPHQVSTVGNVPSSAFPMPIPVGSFGGPFMMPPGPTGHFPMILPSGIPHVDGGFQGGPYLPQPAPGVISLSELTKFQIQGFRNQVLQIDNQIANHKRLVDEPFLQRQRSELMSFIEKMESMLQSQLDQGRNYLSVTSLNCNTGFTGSASSGGSSTETLADARHGEGSKSDKGIEGNTLHILLSPIASREKPKKDDLAVASPAVVPPIPLFVPSSQSSGIYPKTEDSASQIHPDETKLVVKSEPATKSKLTAAAAKAPPFQPRAHILVRRSESDSASDTPAQASTALLLSSAQTQGLIAPYDGRPNSRRGAPRESDHFASGSSHASLSRAKTMQAPHILDNHYSDLLQRSNTFHTASTLQRTAIYDPFIPHNAVPYLVGSLPAGKHISEVHGSDIGYSRPLTDEEIRARHLYWGNAPRSAMKGSGLPKFDGKDFYPASPTKQMATPATWFNNDSRPSSVTLPDFEHLFDEPGNPGYQTPPRVRAKPSEQNSLFNSSQLALENGIVCFQSPSPHPATCKFENRLSTESSSTKYANDDAPAPEMNRQPPLTAPRNPDFSTLFTSSTAPRYSQPSQDCPSKDKEPATPNYKTSSESAIGDEDETRTLDSWGAPKAAAKVDTDDGSGVASNKTSGNLSQSAASTVEFRLNTKDSAGSPKRKYGSSFAERATTNLDDQHMAFLQNMLRNAATKSAPALSGAISSATAQGYLPQYRGSAAASLAPTMLTMNSLEREEDTTAVKAIQARNLVENAINASLGTVVPLKAENFLPENRPTNRDRPYKPNLAPPHEIMGAEGYMRYLSQKAENDKTILEQGWNSNTTAKGPIMDSEW